MRKGGAERDSIAKRKGERDTYRGLIEDRQSDILEKLMKSEEREIEWEDNIQRRGKRRVQHR